MAVIAMLSCDESSHIRLDASLLSFLPNRKSTNISLASSSAGLYQLNAELENEILELWTSDERTVDSHTPDSDEYMQYLQLIGNKNTIDWQERIRVLSNIAAIDSKYAPFWAQLGNAQLKFAESGPEDAERHFAAAETSLLKSLSLRPKLPFAIHALASVHMRVGRTEEASALLRDAVSHRPASAALVAKLAYTYRYAGLLERSIDEYRLAKILDDSLTNAISVDSQIAKAQIYLGHYESALKTYFGIRELLSQSGKSPDEKMLFYEGLAHFYSSNENKAVQLFDAAIRVHADSVWSQFALAYKQAALGHYGELIETAKQLESGNVKDGERRYRLAHFYALAGDVDSAIDHLAAALAAGNFDFPYSSSDPLLESIRHSSRYKDVMYQMKQRHEQFANNLKPVQRIK